VRSVSILLTLAASAEPPWLDAEEHGLRSEDYDDGDVVAYATDRWLGRVRVEAVHPTWSPVVAPEVVAREMSNLVVPDALESLDPPYPEYAALREALHRLRAAPSWEAPAGGPMLVPGGAAPVAVIEALRTRLAAEDPAATALSIHEIAGALPVEEHLASYTPDLVAAVERFQDRNGLYVDGVVGRLTWRALARTREDTILLLERNLDRWRWMPRDVPPREIRVNVAAFQLDLLEDGRVVDAMKVAAGRVDWRTPPFRDRVAAVTLHPSWRVPRSIMRRELAIRAPSDPDALRAFEVEQGGRTIPFDPEAFDWSSDHLVQRAGPENPLGSVKVELTNELGVYLHDTPDRAQFDHMPRTFSHGCIRVERAVDLAAWLTGRSVLEIEALLERPKTRVLAVPAPVTVHVVYFTAWPAVDGTIRFATDVYGYDRRWDRARR
jgi:murein L,D-transpeptidase YcbB/YkuD